MLRKFILAGAAIGLLTAPAAAQFPTPGMHLRDEPKTETAQDRAKRKAIDDAYNAATKKIPDKQAADPWASVRPSPSAPGQRSSN